MGIISVTLSQVVIGLISAGLVGSVLYLKDIIRDKYLEYKYPVSGKFISTFEDEVDGERTTTRAPAELNQSGRQIEGYTEIPGDDREWVLDGEVSTNGYINGVYRAIDPHDSGVGNFFLYVNHDRQMEGLWSGYDEVNDKITSGRYTFVPVFDDFEIRPLERSQIPTVVNIADSQLGKDYLSVELLEESLETDSPYFTKVAITVADTEHRPLRERVLSRLFGRESLRWRSKPEMADTTGEIVGFCIGAVLDQEALRSYLLADEEDLPEGLKHADTVGVVRTISVREEYQGRGIGTDLVGSCVDECQASGCGVVCSVGWEDDGEVNIGGIMQRLGFSKVDRYESYWHEDSLEKGYECETCGEPPCNCPAVLFTHYQ